MLTHEEEHTIFNVCGKIIDKVKAPRPVNFYYSTFDTSTVLTVAKCGAASVTMNAVVNSFMSSKKLQLNQLKCAKIHVGKKCGECPELFAQKEHMKNSYQEKYLGDLMNKDGKQHATVVERISKGYGIVANILALINDIPL